MSMSMTRPAPAVPQPPEQIYQALVRQAEMREDLPADFSDLLERYLDYALDPERKYPKEVMVAMAGYYAVLLDAILDGTQEYLLRWCSSYFNNGALALPWTIHEALEAAYAYLTQDWLAVYHGHDPYAVIVEYLDGCRKRRTGK